MNAYLCIVVYNCATFVYINKCIYAYIYIYMHVWIYIIYIHNLYTATVSLFESSSVQLRSKEDLEGAEY